MKHRGQLSIEFLLVFVYFLMVVSLIFAISSDFTEKQSKAHIKQQETMIANSIAKIVSAAKGFETGTYSVEYLVPKIYLPGKPIGLPCKIEIRQNKVKVEVQFKGETVASEISTNFEGGTSIDTQCGKMLTLS